LIERLVPRELDLGDRVGIENGEADLVVQVAGQDDVLVDDGDRAIEDQRRRRTRCLTVKCRGSSQRCQ
jgi:hypothetical protein